DRGPDNTTGNFTTIGDQYLLKLPKLRFHLLSKVQCSKSKVFLPASRTLDFGPWTLNLLFDSEQRLPIFNRLSVFNINLRHFAAGLSLNLIHQLHGLDDADHRIRVDAAADLHKRFGVRRRGAIKSADDRRWNKVEVLIFGGLSLSLGSRMNRRRG